MFIIARIVGREHDGSYASGRFCSDHCRRVYSGKKVQHHICHFKVERAPYGTWKCPHCEFIGETRALLNIHKKENHPEMSGRSHPCWNKGLNKENSEIIRKAAEKYKQGVKEGRIIPKVHRWTEDEKIRMSKIRSEYLMNHDGSRIQRHSLL